MKIAILADGYPSKGNPQFIFVQQLVHAIVDLGHDVYVIAQQSLTHALIRGEKILSKHTVEYTKNNNSYQVYRPYRISFGNGRKLLYKIFNGIHRKSIHSILDTIKPDVLYGHFWHNANKFTEYAHKHSLPVFVACGEGDNALENLVKNLTQKKLELLTSAIKGVISVSSENKRKCVDFKLAKESDVIVLPNCVDDSIFHPTEKNYTLRNKLGVRNDDFLILFIGYFIKRKGPDRLINAVNKLNDKNIKLIFIGKTMGGDEVEPINDNIVFKGTIDHDELPHYFNAADLFVLPTLKEGCCNAIVESLACGLPVVSANRPFNDDILNHNNSIRIDPENIEEIANAIFKFKNNKDFYSSIKESTLNNSNQYSITTRAEKIIEFIKSKI